MRLPAGSSRPLFLILAITARLLCPSPMEAQLRERGPLILELPTAASALALGNAFPLAGGSSEVLFYQPGGLADVQGMMGSLQRFGPEASLSAFSTARSWLSGGVALGVQILTYGTAANADPLVLPEEAGDLRAGGAVAASEAVFSLGYGRRVMGVRTGAVVKLVQQRLGSSRASTAAADLGLAFAPGPISVGLAVQNLGPEMTLRGSKIPLPVRFAVDASTRSLPVGPLDVAAAGTVSYRLDGDLVPGAGVELAYWPVTGRTFVGRVGYRHLPEGVDASPVTFGAAFRGDNIILEYAFQSFETGDPSHRFGIGWR